jgi:ubiquinone/menaquinone biosynthesis C-methylase UbiE/uncharacterized protein YbaR (Trm112 family)
MKKSLLSYLICPECKGDELEIEIYKMENTSIDQGRLICRSCQAWYRVQNGIPDLLPLSLRMVKRYETFAREHDLPFQNRELYGEKQKLDQIDFFAEDSDTYENEVTKSPYFMALDQTVFEDWVERNLKPKSLVLDVGSGTGRQILSLAQRGIQVIGIDISEEMLLVARKKIKAMGFLEYVDFIVCDAEIIPLKNIIFDGCVVIGTLHHVHRPEVVVRNAAKMIRDKGVFYSYDPHRSPARFIFDYMMKIWKLYDEKANEDSLFTEKQLIQMLNKAKIRAKTKISTYLPPHFFYFFNHQNNVKLLKLTDRIFNSIPIVRKMGGMVIVEGRRID